MIKDDEEQISEGLNQVFEIINAKGDIGELNQIVEKPNSVYRQEEYIINPS